MCLGVFVVALDTLQAVLLNRDPRVFPEKQGPVPTCQKSTPVPQYRKQAFTTICTSPDQAGNSIQSADIFSTQALAGEQLAAV
ncbi:hypothetical protein DSO57_1020752 [Entomophthora muscae]|uniref:Uncharacterized protein n=1 Tax=Entomophthora muscae TaxID=34485 RepID=A0ACC2S5K5_9FUNG|nr:hypothetical protein DSO57_1020752 [Entomophthora muscae]